MAYVPHLNLGLQAPSKIVSLPHGLPTLSPRAVAAMSWASTAAASHSKWHGHATVVVQAAFNGHTEVAKLFIDRGADVIATNANRLTPLHYAASNGAKYLLAACFHRTPLLVP